MYEVRYKGSKVKKDFLLLLSRCSPEIKVKIRTTLENNPYPTPTHGSLLNKITKKGYLYCYPVSGGDRILYDIFKMEDGKKIVLIYFSGNDDGEIRYLKKYAK